MEKPRGLELKANHYVRRQSLDGSQTSVEVRRVSEAEDTRYREYMEYREPPVDVYSQRPAWKSVMIVAACTLAMLVNTANSFGPSFALPTIQRDLNVRQVQLIWIVSGYALSSGCLLLLFGRLADLYGRKRAFIIGNLWLIAFTLGCAFVKTDIGLDVLRAFQGIGAAATIPASLGILAHSFPPSNARSIAFSCFAAGAPLGGAFGIALGGALIEKTKQTWRSEFYLCTALTFLCLVLGMISIAPDEPSTELDRRVDWPGAGLVTLGLVFIVFVLGQGEVAPQKWSTAYIIGFLIAGVFLLLVYLMWQHYLETIQDYNLRPTNDRWIPTLPPLMRLSLWTRANGKVAVVMCIAFANWCCFIGWSFWSIQYYQNYAQLSPIQTMLRLLPMFVTGIICNVIIALVVGRVSLVMLMVIGTGLTSTASLLFAIIDPNAVYWAYGFPAAITAVVGADFVFAAGTLFIAKVSLPHEQSVSGAIFQCMTQLGTSLGVTISTVVFNRILERESNAAGVSIANAPQSVQLKSYRTAQWTNFAFGVLAALLAFNYLRGVGIVGHTSDPPLPPSTDDSREDWVTVEAAARQETQKETGIGRH